MYLQLEDFVGNLFIESIEKENFKGYITYDELNYYIKYVFNNFEQSGLNMRLEIQKYSIEEFKSVFKKYFICVNNNLSYIKLNEEVTITMLWKKFRGTLSVPVMKAFMMPIEEKCKKTI